LRVRVEDVREGGTVYLPVCRRFPDGKVYCLERGIRVVYGEEGILKQVEVRHPKPRSQKGRSKGPVKVTAHYAPGAIGPVKVVRIYEESREDND